MNNPFAVLDRRTLIVIVLWSVIALLIGAPLALSVIEELRAQHAPLPLTYPELPFVVDSPQVHAGELITHHTTRCATDDGGTGLGLLPYWFTRRFVDANEPSRHSDVDGGFLVADVGCGEYSATIHRVPLEFLNAPTAPGRYYFEGTSTAVGAVRSGTVYWRTQVFEVIAGPPRLPPP